MKHQILSLKLDSYKRIILISDIHGGLDIYEKLLKKVNFGEKDFLIILGDMINKGKNSLNTLKYFYKNRNTENTAVLSGNHEAWIYKYIRGVLDSAPEQNPDLYDETLYIANEWLNNLLTDMLLEKGISVNSHDTLKKAMHELYDEYGEILNWMSSLPAGAEYGNFIFAHAGLSKNKGLYDSEYADLLKNDLYLRDETNIGKWVITGHCPAVNFSDKHSYEPVVIENAKKIGIDGGNAVINGGQINAFIIKNGVCETEAFSWDFEDNFPKRTVKKALFPKKPCKPYKYLWPNLEAELLEKGEHFSLCRVKGVKDTGCIKNEYINKMNSITGFLNVSEGERLRVINDTCSGFFFCRKENGLSGWVLKECFE